MLNCFALLVLLASGIVAGAATNSVPQTNDILRYERAQPLFRSNVIARDRGDRLVTILRSPTNFLSWGENVRKTHGTNFLGCVLPVPPETWIIARLTNGASYKIGIPRMGGLVYLPSGLFAAEESARAALAKLAEDLHNDLRQEIINTPKPIIYVPGTVDDGATLSGIARLFYGDASKWRKIYDANRSIIKNPNLIDSRMELTIPK